MSATVKETENLRDIWSGFWQARVLITANNLRVFDHLNKPKNAKAVARLVGTDARATGILLDALTGMGILMKEDNKYVNGETASRYLVRGLPFYQGDIIAHGDSMWKNWSGLDRIVKDGKPNRKSHNHKAFILGMDNLASLKVKNVINAIDLTGVKTALDLGGGPGTYTIELAKQGINVTLFDKAETIKIAKKIIKNSGMKGIELKIGDFNTDDLGRDYDLIIMSQILHSYSEKECNELLKRVYRSLVKGGTVVIQEFYIGEDMATPEKSALFSVNMLVNTENGRCYTENEMKRWLTKAHYDKINSKIMNDTILIQAWK